MLLKKYTVFTVKQLLTHCDDNEFQLSTTILLNASFLTSSHQLFIYNAAL